ncbi:MULTISPECIES: hypothetical protein [unclassified Streptomyces]|uniref:hypothetical protein n=1 Tax=unclassified Streptomyces TaxID=2593676 RepID=UPI00203049F4|nr:MULTISPECIES: hypothetical protein [unclassified Streptomyces]MCM1976506.1 hypothetical protein [Streptomyces sp. G1]MCX5129407.1 hypothetical protein [Streptomyces sp. NBC_00347]
MTRRAHEPAPSHRSLAGAAGRHDAGRCGSGFREFLGMALVAGGLALAVIRPELPVAVVHTLATQAVELAR